MEAFYFSLLGFLFINFVYLFFKFLLAINVGVHDEKLFLGYGKHEAFKIKIKGLTIFFGLFIPLPWLAKFYNYSDGVKSRITYEWELYQKPWGLRLLVTFGGTLGALLTSILIFSVLSYQEQDRYISKKDLNQFGIYPSAIAESVGFKKGDRILKLNGQDYERFEELLSPTSLLDGSSSYQILRNEDTLLLQSKWDIDELAATSSFVFVPNAPSEVLGFSQGAPALEAGMKTGDVITQIDSIPVSSLQEIRKELLAKAGDETSIQIRRGEEVLNLSLQIPYDGTLGFYSNSLIPYSRYQKSIFEALSEGAIRPFEIIGLNLKGLAQVLGLKQKKNTGLSGPIRIANLFGGKSTAQFFRISALLLAIIPLWDLFPFPKSAALKSIPILSEVVFRKRMSFELFSKIKKTGWFLVVAIMIGTLIRDISNIV